MLFDYVGDPSRGLGNRYDKTKKSGGEMSISLWVGSLGERDETGKTIERDKKVLESDAKRELSQRAERG